ncbi:MAG: hypothetical protein H0X25_00940 [Acidobacteriales bacterium]|nr:hypothetical protein [Terriglobales bacterium]
MVDGDEVMNALKPYQNIIVLYGRIHTEHIQQTAYAEHYAARAMILALPDA